MKLLLLTSPRQCRGGSSTHRVCYRSSGRCRYLTSETKVSKEFKTVFSSPRKLYLVLVHAQNRHQPVTSTVTRLLVCEAWRLATPTTALGNYKVASLRSLKQLRDLIECNNLHYMTVSMLMCLTKLSIAGTKVTLVCT